MRRKKDEFVEAFRELRSVEERDPAIVGMPDESDVMELEFVEELVEPLHEIAGMARLSPVDASSQVVDEATLNECRS